MGIRFKPAQKSGKVPVCREVVFANNVANPPPDSGARIIMVIDLKDQYSFYP